MTAPDSLAGLRLEASQEEPIPLQAQLACARGEILALVGPSGSGKTTLLRTIAGLYRPRESLVTCAGEVWTDTATGRHRPTHERRVGYVFQSYALFPHLTAEANVAAALGHLRPDARLARARDILARVNLSGLERRRPADLSGGQQQRVAMARALAREPTALLLDEPFSAVDRATRQRLYRELVELRSTIRCPTLLVTHDLHEAALLADRLTILHHGTTLQTGEPSEVLSRPASVDVARLVDIRNIFEGRIADQEAGRTWLSWQGRRLEAAPRPDLQPGTSCCWCIPPADVILHRRDRPSRGERENPVAAEVVDLLVLGETAAITLAVDGSGEHPLHLSVPLHVVRRNDVRIGVMVGVSLLASSIHLMPHQSLGRARGPS